MPDSYEGATGGARAVAPFDHEDYAVLNPEIASHLDPAGQLRTDFELWYRE